MTKYGPYDVCPAVVMKCPRCGVYDEIKQLYIWGVPFEYPVCSSCQDEYTGAISGHAEAYSTEVRKIYERVGLERKYSNEGLTDQQYMLKHDIRLHWIGANKETLCEKPKDATSSPMNGSTMAGSRQNSSG